MTRMDKTHITDLPEEVLRIIFSKLPTSIILSFVIEVCNGWKLIVDSDILFWERLRIVIDCNAFLAKTYLDPSNPPYTQINEMGRKDDWIIYVGEGDLKKVCKMRNIKFLNFNRTSNQHDLFLVRVLEIIGKTCEDIIRVRFTNCLGTNSKYFMKRLGERYKDIRELVFGINSVYFYPYDELVCFSNLQTFVSMDYAFVGKNLNTLADSCVSLKHLWITNSRFVKNEHLIWFLDKRKNTIEEIGIGFRVTDEVLSKMEECQKLKVLFVADARGLSAAVFNSIIKLENLEYVSLQRAIFNPEALASWILSTEILTKLSELDLAGYYHIQGLRKWANDIRQKCIETRQKLTERTTKKNIDFNFRQSNLKTLKRIPDVLRKHTTNY